MQSILTNFEEEVLDRVVTNYTLNFIYLYFFKQLGTLERYPKTLYIFKQLGTLVRYPKNIIYFFAIYKCIQRGINILYM